MKELQAKAKVTPDYDPVTVWWWKIRLMVLWRMFPAGRRNRTTPRMPRARLKKILERAEDIKDGHENKKESEKGGRNRSHRRK